MVRTFVYSRQRFNCHHLGQLFLQPAGYSWVKMYSFLDFHMEFEPSREISTATFRYR